MEAFDNGFRPGPYRKVRPGLGPVIERYRGPGMIYIEYNTGYSVSPEVPARPRVGSPDGRRPEGDPIRGRAGTEEPPGRTASYHTGRNTRIERNRGPVDGDAPTISNFNAEFCPPSGSLGRSVKRSCLARWHLSNNSCRGHLIHAMTSQRIYLTRAHYRCEKMESGTCVRSALTKRRRDLIVRTPRGTPPVAGIPPGHISYVTDQMNRIKPMPARLLNPAGASRGYIPDGHRPAECLTRNHGVQPMSRDGQTHSVVGRIYQPRRADSFDAGRRNQPPAQTNQPHRADQFDATRTYQPRARIFQPWDGAIRCLPAASSDR
ncbi:hypothetical protein Bbelb_441820 [Branchiostoma belcheri]|nr:hypothetical protein Bbelb_441820 [Branchiostoma belcheri]